MAADTVKDLVRVLALMKDHGVMLASVPLMIDVSDGPERKYVNGRAEFIRDDTSGDKWLVVRPKLAGEPDVGND
jgi:hypothetical protein